MAGHRDVFLVEKDERSAVQFLEDLEVAGGGVVAAFAVTGMEARHENTAGGSANRRSGVAVGEEETLFGHTVDVGCHDVLRAVAAEIGIALVIGHDEDDVGRGGARGSQSEECGEEKGKENAIHSNVGSGDDGPLACGSAPGKEQAARKRTEAR